MWTRENRGRMAGIARKSRRYPSDLTDAEWDRIAPLVSEAPPRRRKPAVDFCEILNAIQYMARSVGGCCQASSIPGRRGTGGFGASFAACCFGRSATWRS